MAVDVKITIALAQSEWLISRKFITTNGKKMDKALSQLAAVVAEVLRRSILDVICNVSQHGHALGVSSRPFRPQISS